MRISRLRCAPLEMTEENRNCPLSRNLFILVLPCPVCYTVEKERGFSMLDFLGLREEAASVLMGCILTGIALGIQMGAMAGYEKKG